MDVQYQKGRTRVWSRSFGNKRILLSFVLPQCITLTKMNDQHIINILLKINVKLDGLNPIEYSPSIAIIVGWTFHMGVLIGLVNQ